MDSIFVLNVGDAKKQLQYERDTRQGLIEVFCVKILSNNQLTPKQVEDCAKKKKPKMIIFDGVPEQIVRTLVNHLKRKFPHIKYYSTSSVIIAGINYIPKVVSILEEDLAPVV